MQLESAYNKLCLDYDNIPEVLTRINGIEGHIKGIHISVRIPWPI